MAETGPRMDQGQGMALPKGHRIDEYEIERVLGAGGFGVTYLATDVNLGVARAIKEYMPVEFARREADLSVVSKSSAGTEQFSWGLDRFLTEARTLTRFDHPNIVKVLAVIEALGTAYLIMPFEDGESLDEVLEREGTLDAATFAATFSALLDGLETVHAADLLHRDVKPDNIFLRTDGTPLLLDFGAARSELAQRTRSLTGIVAEGYTPVEQYSGETRMQGPWTDLYALSATAYRALTGNRPPPSPQRIAADGLVPLADRGGDLPSGLDANWITAIDTCMALRPDMRCQSVAAFRAILEGKRAPTKPEPRPEPEPVVIPEERVRPVSKPRTPPQPPTAPVEVKSGGVSILKILLVIAGLAVLIGLIAPAVISPTSKISGGGGVTEEPKCGVPGKIDCKTWQAFQQMEQQRKISEDAERASKDAQRQAEQIQRMLKDNEDALRRTRETEEYRRRYQEDQKRQQQIQDQLRNMQVPSLPPIRVPSGPGGTSP